MATVRPGMLRASVCATWSNVLWSSLRTITRHSPPSPLPGPSTRGSSTVWLTGLRLAVPAPQDGENDGHGCRDRAKDLGVLQARDEHRADDLADGQRALLGGMCGGVKGARGGRGGGGGRAPAAAPARGRGGGAAARGGPAPPPRPPRRRWWPPRRARAAPPGRSPAARPRAPR